MYIYKLKNINFKQLISYYTKKSYYAQIPKLKKYINNYLKIILFKLYFSQF